MSCAVTARLILFVASSYVAVTFVCPAWLNKPDTESCAASVNPGRSAVVISKFSFPVGSSYVTESPVDSVLLETIAPTTS